MVLIIKKIENIKFNLTILHFLFKICVYEEQIYFSLKPILKKIEELNIL